MLHIISHSASQFDVQALLRSVSENDAVLLIQNGVTIAIDDTPLLLSLAAQCVNVYALSDDVLARGLSGLISSQVSVVDYDTFVDLTVEYTPALSW